MTITDVHPVPGFPGRRIVVLDERVRLEVTEEIYARFSLFKGREVDADLIADVRRAEEDLRARQVALNFLAPRMRSRFEVDKRLRERGFDDAVIERTLTFLSEYAMLNDVAFAQAFVNDRLLKKAVGPRRLAMELRKRGIGGFEAENALQVIDDARERRLCLRAARGRLRSLRPGDPAKRERALSSFLAGRGFGWEAIRFVIDAFRRDPDLPHQSEVEPE